MIPFARMAVYGNIAPKPIEVLGNRLQSHYSAKWYLHKNGDLYHLGSNSLGQGGTGSTVTSTAWALVNSGVVRYFGGVHGTFVFKSDNSIWYTGTRTAFQQLSANTGGSWLNVTSYFSALGVSASDIKDIAISESIRVLLTDGRLMFCGNNQTGHFGNGSTATVSTFTFSTTTDIESMACTFNSTVLRMNNASVKYAGQFVLAGGTAVSNTTTFTDGLTSVKRVAGAYQVIYFLMEDGTVRTSALNGNGQAGTGTTSVVPMTSLINFTTSGTVQTFSSLTNSSGMSPIIYNNSVLWRCGANGNGQCGNGRTQTAETTLVQMDLTNLGSNKLVSFCGDNNLTILLDDQDNMYMCGLSGISGLAAYNIPTILPTARMPWKQ